MVIKTKTTYETIIGLEIHVQLDTKTKIFCRCDNNSEGKEPNTNVCSVCMGYPGTLPVINEQVIEWGIKISLALGCEINPMQRFDRKNYFYPDLPKGYQISQFFYPAGEHGVVEVDYLASDRKTKLEFKVGITRLHLEEDAGKLIHADNATLVDLNRCGTPLAEIVTEPDIKSPEEARAFLQELQRIVRTIGVSKADMEKGHLRVDANVSVRPKGQKEFGTKVEVKNINSFKFVEKALKHEVERQIELIEGGGRVDQETRGWDAKNNVTVSQRGKEGDIDYRYFPEPDLPPIYTNKKQIDDIQNKMPNLPSVLRERVEKHGLSYDKVSDLQDMDAPSLVAFVDFYKDKEITDFYGKLSEEERKQLAASVWKLLVYNFSPKQKLDYRASVSLLIWTLKNSPTGDRYDKIFIEMHGGKLSPEEANKKIEGSQAGDSNVETAIKNILVSEKDVVDRYKQGEDKLFGYLVGLTMKKMKGTAEPVLVARILKKLLTK